MTSSDTVTNVFHDSLCLSNLLVKRIDLKLCVSQNLKKMLCLIIYRVYKMFDWFAGDGFRCSSALCLFQELPGKFNKPKSKCIREARLNTIFKDGS